MVFVSQHLAEPVVVQHNKHHLKATSETNASVSHRHTVEQHDVNVKKVQHQNTTKTPQAKSSKAATTSTKKVIAKQSPTTVSSKQVQVANVTVDVAVNVGVKANAVSHRQTANVTNGQIANVTKISAINESQVAVQGEPCLEWIHSPTRVQANLLGSYDDRLSYAPHLMMVPTAFSTPSYFGRACTIGSPEPTTRKCVSELKAIDIMKVKIKIAIDKAHNDSASINETLRNAFPHNLCLSDEPLKSFVMCHCGNCDPNLAEIPEELFWRDIWNMVGKCQSFPAGQNLCPSLAQIKREEVREQIAMDELFRTAWNTEMGKVLDEHRAVLHSRSDQVEMNKTQNAAEDVTNKTVEVNPQYAQKAGSGMIATHRLAFVMQIAVTIGAVFFSFFMYYQ